MTSMSKGTQSPTNKASGKLNPYIKHGQKNSNRVKKITVSVPLEIHEAILEERTRRQNNRMRHATTSELLCEAFAHAFTGQPLPTDEELYRYVSRAKQQTIDENRQRTKQEAIMNAGIVTDTYISSAELRNLLLYIISDPQTTDGQKQITIFRLITLLCTYIIQDILPPYALNKESIKLQSSIEMVNRFKQFVKFVDYNQTSVNRNHYIASEIFRIIEASRDGSHKESN